MASSNQEKMDEQDHLQKDRCSFDGFPWFFASSLPLFSLCLSHLLESMPQGIARTIYGKTFPAKSFIGINMPENNIT